MTRLPNPAGGKVVSLSCSLLFGLLFFIWPGALGTSLRASSLLREFALGSYDPVEETGRVVFFQGKAEEEQSILESAASAVEDVIFLVNQNRRSAGLLPLKANPILNATAQMHSDHMRKTGCFAHHCPGEEAPPDRICRAGYGRYGQSTYLNDCAAGGPGPGTGACFIGEVIAAGYPNPEAVVEGWMASVAHANILMNPLLREIGAGCATGGPYHTYWTVDAGSQPNMLPVFINNDDPETPSPQVTLSLTNEEIPGSSGITYAREVAISNDPGFSESVWEPYSPYKPWHLLEGAGPKSVYVKYRDARGVEVLSRDDILLR